MLVTYLTASFQPSIAFSTTFKLSPFTEQITSAPSYCNRNSSLVFGFSLRLANDLTIQLFARSHLSEPILADKPPMNPAETTSNEMVRIGMMSIASNDD